MSPDPRQFALGIACPEHVANLGLDSLPALAEIQGIGHLVNSLPGFDDNLTKALRADLGDWRQPLEIDLKTLLDPAIRTEFYVSQGLARELVELPEFAFRGGMASAGLEEAKETPNEDDETTEDGFQRTNEAHDQLMRFEYELRQFILKLMSNAHGDSWIKHRVPGNVLGKWKQKKRADSSEGSHSQPLFAYADLSDVLVIITRRDNWQDTFEAVFQHRSSVEESFRRIAPIRNCTMHARLITKEDELYLKVELMRLRKAFC